MVALIGATSHAPGRLGRLACLLGLLLVLPFAPEAAAQDIRTLVAGREGWVQDGDDWQGILRAELSEPESPERTVGSMVLTCSSRGYRFYFSAYARSLQRLPDPLADGTVHLRADNGRSVSLYAIFDGAISFRTRASAASGAGDPGDVIELLFEANRTLELVLSPRAPTRRFLPQTRIRLILEPGDVFSGATLMESLLGFAADCEARQG